jgi:hypothetical protein
MRKERSAAIRRRLGPIGLSLLASALTAAGFAAFSIADSGGGNDNGGRAAQTLPGPPPGAGGEVTFAAPRLSAEDEQKMQEFKQCMSDNGGPAPPDPGDFDPSNPPKPPSAEDQQKIQKAWEACKDKLPDALQKAGPPRIGVGPCQPPPGAVAPNKGGNQDQSNDSSGQSSGSDS